MKSFKALVGVFVLLSLAWGENNMDDVTRAMTGTRFGKTSAEKNVKNPMGKKHSLAEEEAAVYSHILVSESRFLPPQQAQEDKEFAFDVAAARKKCALSLAKRKARERSEEKKREALRHEIRFARGYCYIPNDIVVERMASYAFLDCDLYPLGKARLAVSLVPEFYARALIATPMYVITDQDQHLPVQTGVVTTKDKNSINIANVVNDYLLKKILATGAYRSVGIAAKQAQAYLDDSRDANNQGTTTVIPGTPSTVITTNQRDKPDIAHYAIAAGIQMVSELAKTLGENFVRSLPYTFKVNKGAIVFADLQFAPGTRVVGYDSTKKTIIRKEPDFVDGILQDRKIEDPMRRDDRVEQKQPLPVIPPSPTGKNTDKGGGTQ